MRRLRCQLSFVQRAAFDKLHRVLHVFQPDVERDLRVLQRLSELFRDVQHVCR